MAEPTKIDLPFAENGTKNDIPDASLIGIEDGRASFNDGFPPLNGTPIGSGGIPPFKSDMNGILNHITRLLKFFCSGGIFKRDGTFQSTIGGYPVSALLAKASLNGYWFNATDNNATDPDTGGAGWAHLNPLYIATATGTANAITATYSPAITSVYTGLRVVLKATAANTTTTPTFSPNGLTPATIVKNNGQALAVGDIAGSGHYLELMYDSSAGKWLLQNPAVNSTVAFTQTNPGYLKLPNWLGGFVLQWGTVYSPSSSSGTVSFPIAFPNACLGRFTANTNEAATTPSANTLIVSPYDARVANSFKWSSTNANTGSLQAPGYFFWMAWGY